MDNSSSDQTTPMMTLYRSLYLWEEDILKRYADKSVLKNNYPDAIIAYNLALKITHRETKTPGTYQPRWVNIASSIIDELDEKL